METRAPLLFMALLLSITSYSSATYCVCIDGAGDTALQQDIDYACGAGADCSAIQVDGACYQPNTVKSHCDYAVNNYFQKMGQVDGSCNFTGTAMITNTLPTSVVSGCTYPASSSQVTSDSTTFGFAPTGSADSATNAEGNASFMHQSNSLMNIFFSVLLLVLWASN